MKKILAISACIVPFIIAPAVFAQTGQPGTAPATATPAPGGAPMPAAPGAAPGMPGAVPGARATPSRAAPPTETISGTSIKKQFMGQSVYNEKNVKVGDIDDVVLASDGKVSTVVIGAGGFLGMGKHDVAIPFDKIKERNNKLVLEGYTKDQLKAMPAVEVKK